MTTVVTPSNGTMLISLVLMVKTPRTTTPDQASRSGLGNFSCLIRRSVDNSVAIRPI